MKKKAGRSAALRKDDKRRAVQAARRARQRAHAPYSRFQVGAALIAPSGKVITGCNVENASSGLTICAERVAVTRAIAEGQRQFRALVVATADRSYPCGACLQVLAEFCDDLPILLVDDTSPEILETRLRDLLPRAFRSAKLQARPQ